MIRDFEETEPEWLDTAERSSPELESELSGMESLNCRFCVQRVVIDGWRPLLRGGRALRIADLGAGTADIARAVVSKARKLLCPVIITAIDHRKTFLQVAEKRTADFPEIRFVCADILDFRAEQPFDAVLCSQVLHRLDESAAIRMLRRCRELAGGMAMVTDWRRSRLAQAGVFAATGVFRREPMIRHDARLAMRRAFSYAELYKLAVAAGWWGFRHERRPVFLQTLRMDAARRRH